MRLRLAAEAAVHDGADVHFHRHLSSFSCTERGPSPSSQVLASELPNKKESKKAVLTRRRFGLLA